MELEILKPSTVAKVTQKTPTVTINTKSGPISISEASANLLQCTEMYFAHHAKDRTTYIIPSPEGFTFRAQKKSKGLAFNHTVLARKIIDNNTRADAPVEEKMVFRLASAAEIHIESKPTNAFALIRIQK